MNREIRPISVPPMRVARFQVTSLTPEFDALAKLQAWAGPKGYLDQPETHPVFGFNNPEQLEGTPDHGYEFWIGVDAGEVDESLAFQDFGGGRYIATECVLGEDQTDYLASWGKLETWARENGYAYGGHQWLEVACGDTEEGLILRLHYPIVSAGLVLPDVPKLTFAARMCPFPGSLYEVLAYTGDPVDYDILMGTTGACFRRFWNRDDGGNIDLSYYGQEPFQRVFWALGYAWEQVPAEKAEMVAAIRRSLAKGRPVISFGILGPPEAGLVTGYAEGGDVLYGWSYFQNWPQYEQPDDRYYESRDWFETMDKHACKGLIVVGDRVGSGPYRLDVLRASLEWAVKLETTAVWPEVPAHVGGLAALDAWADALEIDEDYPAGDGEVMMTRTMVHGDQCTMMTERRNAAGFLRKMAEQVPGVSPEVAADLRAAADCYDATECMELLWPWPYDQWDRAQAGMADPALRRKMAARLREVRVKEAEAVGYLEKALRGM